MSGITQIEDDDEINETLSRIAVSQRSIVPCTEPPPELTEDYEMEDQNAE